MRSMPLGWSSGAVRKPDLHRDPVSPSVWALAFVVIATIAPMHAMSGVTMRDESLTIRGRAQTLHLYGAATGMPAVVTSGDGGWVHLAPHVAEMLAARGYFVVGVDSRAYLSSFTSGSSTLSTEDVPRDLRAVLARASHASSTKPILVGVSEGAGLAVLAAGDVGVQQLIEGVVVLGLPDRNELAWRWKDAVIYVTHGVPNEPLFSAAAVVAHVAPVPLAGIYASHDEFVSADDARRVEEAAREPKRFWTISAADHRFSDTLNELDARLSDALAWMSGKGH